MLDQTPTTKPASTRDSLSEQWIDLRLISGMRVVLGTSALLVSVLGAGDSRPSVLPTQIALVLYSLYGLLIYHLSVRRNPIAVHRLIPLNAISGTFYYFFFFSIVVASFS